MNQPLKLRGHHLLCSLNYSGSGYTEAFTANFTEICARLTAGESAQLTWQPDSICQPMLGHPACHCHKRSIPVRDFLGFLATSLALRRWCFPPHTVKLTQQDITRLRHAFRSGVTRSACVGCEWFGHCSRTAAAGWPKSKLYPMAPWRKMTRPPQKPSKAKN